MPYINNTEYNALLEEVEEAKLEAANARGEVEAQISALRGELHAKDEIIDKLLNKLIVAGLIGKSKE